MLKNNNSATINMYFDYILLSRKPRDILALNHSNRQLLLDLQFGQAGRGQLISASHSCMAQPGTGGSTWQMLHRWQAGPAC